MRIPLVHIGSVLVCAGAGLCVFLVLLNRCLILRPDSRLKALIILLSFALITGSSIAIGLWLPGRPWVFAPVVVLCLIVAGEARRAFIRRSCAGSAPVDTTPHAVSLSSPVTTTDLVCHRYQVACPNWQGRPFRVVHLTDLHVHPGLPTEHYQRVLDVAEQTEPDLAVVTGDFVTGLDSLPTLRQVLRPIGRAGSFAVLGNHDYWADPGAVGAVVRESGLRLLANDSASIAIDGHEVVITGYDYPWGTEERSVPSQEEGALHLVLSHTPDNIYRIAESSADVVFSGHYHAGQIRLPLLGPIVVPSVYGRRFDHGHFVVRGTHLFVASGVGAANPPLRIYCQPDIFVVDISGASAKEGTANKAIHSDALPRA